MRTITKLAAAVLLMALSAWGQSYQVIQGQALKTVNGTAMPFAGATVTVCAANAAGLPCAPALVNTLFSNTGLTTALANPFTADANGNYAAYVAPGNYTVTITGTGFAGYSYQVGTSSGGGGSSGNATQIQSKAVSTPISGAGCQLTYDGSTNFNCQVKPEIDARDYGLAAGGADNTSAFSSMMTALGGSGANGSVGVTLPGAANAQDYYYFSTGADLDVNNLKIKCSSEISSRRAGVTLVAGAGYEFTVNANIQHSGFEGCAFNSLSYGAGVVSSGSASVTGITFYNVGPITNPGCANGDGVIIIGRDLKHPTFSDIVVPTGAYFTTCSGTSGTLATGFEPQGFSPAWNVAVSYKAGDAVLYSGTAYIATVDNTGVTPGTDGTWDSYATNATLFRLPVQSTATVTSGSATVTTTGGTHLWQAGELVWSSAFPFVVPVTSCTSAAGTTTCTSTTASGIDTNDRVTLLGTSDSNCNSWGANSYIGGVYTATAIDATHFSFPTPASCGNPTGGRVQDLSHIIAVWTASGTVGAQTLTLSQTFTGADAAATFSGSTVLYKIPAAYNEHANGWFFNNYIVGWPVGMMALCSSGADGGNCTGSQIGRNFVEQTWMGLYRGGNNTSTNTIADNSYQHDVTDIREDGTLGSGYTGQQLNSSESNAALSFLANCANQNATGMFGAYMGQAYTMPMCDRGSDGSNGPSFTNPASGFPTDAFALRSNNITTPAGAAAPFKILPNGSQFGFLAGGGANTGTGENVLWGAGDTSGTGNYFTQVAGVYGAGNDFTFKSNTDSTAFMTFFRPLNTKYYGDGGWYPAFPRGALLGGANSTWALFGLCTASPGNTAGWGIGSYCYNDLSSDPSTDLWKCKADDGASPRHCTSWLPVTYTNGNAQLIQGTWFDTSTPALGAIPQLVALAGSYSNYGGTGDRRAFISVSTSATGFYGSGTTTHNPNVLVNGHTDFTNNGAVFFSPAGNPAGTYICFTFLIPEIITEAKFYYSNTVGTWGTFQWQGSNTSCQSGLANIGSTWTWTGTGPETITTLSANTTAYKYYVMTGVSGDTTGSGYLDQFEFKLTPGNEWKPTTAPTFTAIATGTASNTDLAGQLTLVAGTKSYTFAGTYTSAPICTASDTAAAPAAVQVTTSTTTLTLTVPGGANTDTFNYLCVGRN